MTKQLYTDETLDKQIEEILDIFVSYFSADWQSFDDNNRVNEAKAQINKLLVEARSDEELRQRERIVALETLKKVKLYIGEPTEANVNIRNYVATEALRLQRELRNE